MTDVITPEPPAPLLPRRAQRFLSFAANPTVLVVAGAITLVASTAMLTLWIGIHRDVWYSDWACSASIGPPLGVRQVTALTAAVALATLAGSSMALAFRPRRRTRVVAIFWAALVTLWLVMVPMVSTSTFADACFRDRSGWEWL